MKIDNKKNEELPKDANKSKTNKVQTKKHEPYFGDHFELLNEVRQEVKEEKIGKDKTEINKK